VVAFFTPWPDLYNPLLHVIIEIDIRVNKVKSSSAHKNVILNNINLTVDKTGEENVKLAICVRGVDAVSRIA